MSDFMGGGCIEYNDGPNMTATDANNPAPGHQFYYLVRADNACAGRGTLGKRSNGTERTGRSCP